MSAHALDLTTMAHALRGEVSGGQVLAPGPNHSHKDRSLAVRLVADNPDGFVVHSHANDDPLACKDYVREKLGLPGWEPASTGPSPIERMQARAGRVRWPEYIYRDARGENYLRVQRTPDKAFIQSHWTGSAWEKGKPKGAKLPYRLPELISASERPVYICEGEKDADTLANLGLIATTSSEGAGKWTPDLNVHLKGRTCYILADNDEKGELHAVQVARNLDGVAESVRIIRLPDLAYKGDVSDWLGSGRDPNELTVFCATAPLFAAAASAPAPKRGVTAAELFGMVFAPIEWTVRDLITEGLTVLAGKPKLGKSWLCLDIALAVARGGMALGGRQCAKGAVLYAALEDPKHRLRDRLEKVIGPFRREHWSPNLTFWTFGEMERLADGGLDQLRAWITDNPDARLIMIDTFAKVRSGPQGKETAYEADYREVGSLKALADETGVAIMLVTHTRKMAADDPFDTVSGTLGITGAADAIVILARDGLGVTLHATGRDVAELEVAVEFNKVDFAWRELGDARTVRRSDERTDVLDELRDADDGLTPTELAGALGKPTNNVKQLCFKMAKTGELARGARRGAYYHPDRVRPLDDPHNPDNPVTGRYGDRDA